MKRGKRLFLVCVVFAFLVPGLIGQGPDQKKTSEIMRKKLSHAQKILEGVALKDFGLIGKNAEELMLLSQRAEWRVMKTPRYEVCSNEFRRAVDDMITRAGEKNLDGAALSYVEMTLACVKCHKYVRESGMGFLDVPESYRRDIGGAGTP